MFRSIKAQLHWDTHSACVIYGFYIYYSTYSKIFSAVILAGTYRNINIFNLNPGKEL